MRTLALLVLLALMSVGWANGDRLEVLDSECIGRSERLATCRVTTWVNQRYTLQVFAVKGDDICYVQAGCREGRWEICDNNPSLEEAQ